LRGGGIRGVLTMRRALVSVSIMNRFCLNIILGLAVVLLVGCGEGKKEKSILKGVKIGDLAPTTGKGEGRVQLLKTINFKIYILELPAENLGVLDSVWLMLYTKPVRLNDAYAFKANSFSIGVGQMPVWSEVVGQLDAGGAKVVKTVTLLLTSGEPDDLVIAAVTEKRDVSYISGKGSWGAATIGPGSVGLRIKAERIAGSRGVCEVEALPVFSPVILRPTRLMGEQEKRGDLFFTTVGFKLKMSPGDFVLLGPEQYPKDQTTLGGIFFSESAREAAVRAYLLVCTDIID
jgi:hypothetical protein